MNVCDVGVFKYMVFWFMTCYHHNYLTDVTITILFQMTKRRPPESPIFYHIHDILSL